MSQHHSNITLAYDQKLISEGISRIISSKTKHKIIASWPNGQSLLESFDRERTHLLLIEFGNPSKCHADYLKTLCKSFYAKKILIVTPSVSYGIVKEYLDLNIGGILFKNCSTEEFVSAVSRVCMGNNFYCSEITNLLLNNNGNSQYSKQLTHREIAILEMIIEGKNNIEISDSLQISESTVKTHRRNIMNKFSARNTIDLFKLVCKDNRFIHFKSAFCKDCPYNIRMS